MAFGDEISKFLTNIFGSSVSGLESTAKGYTDTAKDMGITSAGDFFETFRNLLSNISSKVTSFIPKIVSGIASFFDGGDSKPDTPSTTSTQTPAASKPEANESGLNLTPSVGQQKTPSQGKPR